MRASEINQSNSKERKDIFSLPIYEPNLPSFLDKIPSKKSSKENNDLNKFSIPLTNNTNENGGNRNHIPKKRNYKDMFLSKMDEEKEPEGKISYQKMSNFNNNESYINSFYNEPSLMKKIRRDEKLNEINNTLTNLNSTNDVTNINFLQNDNSKIEQQEKNKEYISESKRKEIELKKKLEDKKLINEYSNVIEKVLKEEQILFLDDNYHISNSPISEKISEDASNYIISKRVNFPKEIYQSFPSLNYEEEKEDDSSSFSLVYPPLNCIIFLLITKKKKKIIQTVLV